MAAFTLRDIDDTFWRTVKIHAATEGVTIKALILELLAQAIEKPTPKHTKAKP